MTGQTLLQRLAERIGGFGPAQMTPQATALARTAIIDTLAVTLAGSNEPCATLLLRVPGVAAAPGQCTLFGTDRKTSALDAALVNGVASHALDYDDFSQPFGGHQSVPIVSPLFAVADERRLSGAQLLLSYAVGVETEIRLGRAVNFHHYDKGWHPTATLGVFGAAAAVGHMIGLDQAQLATALAIAASSAAGVKAAFGTMVKPLHVGHCCRSGLLAALLAEAGYDANPSALEHAQGFLNAYNGPGLFDAEKLFEGWADPLEVTGADMGLKQFACCGSTHPAISMMLALRRDEGIDPADVERIEVMPHRRRLPHTDNPDPRSALAAKFSVQYAVARALLDGAVRLRHFEGDAHLDLAVRAVMAKIVVRPHPDMAEDSTEQFGAEVRVTRKDGRVVARRVDGMVGRGGANPMSSEELWEKFYDCGRRVLPKQDLLPLFERLETLDKVADVSDITRMLARRNTPGAASPRRAAVATAAAPAAAPGNTLVETSWVP